MTSDKLFEKHATWRTTREFRKMMDEDQFTAALAEALCCGHLKPGVMSSADDVDGRGEATGGALKALQMAYLYHCMDDDEIGSSELGDTLLDAICNIMGDNAYQQWADSNHQRIRGDG